jgi:putative acetyltransferase
LSIRPEEPRDIQAIHRVEELAFGRAFEADAADLLRDHGKALLSLVAKVDSEVVGHVMFSYTTIETSSGSVVEASLGPIAVLPERQGAGIGSSLVREGLAACVKLGYGAVFLLGNPAYYRRFGFRPAAEFGIRYHQELSSPEAFQAVELRPGALAGLGGVAREEPELG